MTINITRFKQRISSLILIISDILSLIIIFQIAKLIRIYILPKFLILPSFNHKTEMYLWIFLIYIIVFLYEKSYTKILPLWDDIKTTIKSIIISTIIIFSIFFIGKISEIYSRTLIITYNILLILLLPILKTIIKKILYKSKLLVKKTLIIGSGELAKEIYNSIKKEPELCYQISGFVDDNPKNKKINGHKIHKGIYKIETYIKLAHITDVIIAKEDIDEKELSKLVNKIQHKAENVIYIPEIKGIAVYGTETKYFFQDQIIALEIKNNLSNPIIYLNKRVIDYILGIIVFIMTLPLMILLSLIIKLTTPGPIIYSHKRIGKNAKTFNCYKFRTMYLDADKKLKEILEKDLEKKKEWETYWKLKDDPRVTPIGKFLRKTSLDELPQIFNVLKGEMSLVGPRPYLPREWNYIKKESPIIHALPPGITGLWQVSGRSNTSYEYRVSLDSWYVKNWNLWLDIVILLKTIKAVIKKEGAC